MKIIFCLPGRQFSSDYFICWNKTLDYLRLQGIDVKFSNAYNPICATTRNSILLANMYQKGKNTEQKPFAENVKYDYLFWIDDDIVWNPEQVLQLIDHKKDIVSGCYVIQGKQAYPICKQMDDKDLIETGSYKFITKQEMANEKKIFKVDYVGFGFLLIKHGIFESMKYPWFENPVRTVGDVTDLTSEDVYWCMKAKQQGYEIYVDPNCLVGHQKNIVLA
jgi:GT2 family glycosyltransferase